MIKGALLSKSGRYRYKLWRIWDNTKPLVLFVGINPSTADDKEDDPTITRLIDFAMGFGYGGFYIGNLYALRTSKPAELFKSENRLGKWNDTHLLAMFMETKDIVIMWGSKKKAERRAEEFFKLFLRSHSFYCFGKCNDGSPMHPLFLSKETKLKLYERN